VSCLSKVSGPELWMFVKWGDQGFRLLICENREYKGSLPSAWKHSMFYDGIEYSSV